jgi:hypothetical protein
MNKIKLFYLATALIGFSVSSPAAELCKTHQICETGAKCECILGAEGAYARYFYIDFVNVQKGNLYTCTFTSKPSFFTLVPEASTFPYGVTYTSSGSFPRFPLALSVNTKAMQAKSDTMIIKYFVPPSDMPSNINAACEISPKN